MAQKPEVRAYQKYFKRYYYELVQCLPMDDAFFIGALTTHELLPSDTCAKIRALPTQADKTSYLLEHVIKPSLDCNSTSSFYKLLHVMENCSFDHVKELAHKIRSKIAKASYIKPGGYVCIRSYYVYSETCVLWIPCD